MLPGCTPWPEEVAEGYRRAGYWRGETLGALLRDRARTLGERTALVAGERRWSYAELDSRADRLATGLRGLGIAAGDRVVVHLPNVPELLLVSFALFRLGALPVFTLPPHRRAEIVHVCTVAEAVAYVIPDRFQGFDHRDLAAEVRRACPSLRHVLVAGDAGGFTALDGLDTDPVPLPEPDPADVALFLLSGGTTGPPKLIPRTHDDYGYNVRLSAGNAELTERDVYLAVLPVAHNYALGCPGVLGALWAGGRVVLAASGSPDEALPLIERERVTVTGLVPPLAQLWLDTAEAVGADLSSLRLVQVGGAKFTPEAARRVRPELGCALQQSFGMAEGLLSQSHPDDPADIVDVAQGRPLSPADEIRVVDADDRDVPAGTVGHLLTRGPYTLRGYYRAEEYNATAFTPDGYFRTGDLVRELPGGHLVVEGRARDVINRGGDKVSASEIEDHLAAHPAVRDAAVVAMPDRIMGERTCVYVVPSGEPPRLTELTAFLRDRGVAAYKLPDRLEIVETFPYTSVGKVDKKELRAAIAAKLGAVR